ncbi:MAG: efflux RND transporter periplasmic adaptor subunit [Halioglobus sp.]
MKLIIPLGIVIVAIIVAMIMIGSREELGTSDAPQPLPHVQAVEVTLGEVPIAIIAHGNVSARYELELASQVSGRVIWVSPQFQPGELVAADTVLLRIDPVNYRLAVAEAKAALESANIALADATALKRKAAVEESKLNIEAARQRIVKAEQDLAYTEIRAPFNAVIDTQLVEYGQFISAGRTVARLLSTDTAEATLPVTSAEAGFLEDSIGADVELSAQIGAEMQHWRGKLLRIESRVDQLSRVVPVVVEVESPYDPAAHRHRLPLGLFVTATLPGKPVAAAVRLPSAVLQPDDSVFVVVDNALQRRRVNIVHREGNNVVINGGLETGDLVVTTRLDVMFQGMKVERQDG